MKIAIDCRTILNPGFGEEAGVGHYTYHLVWHLLRFDPTNEYVLFFDKQLGQGAIKALAGDCSKCQVRFFPFHEYKRYLPGFYSHFLISAAIARERPDILHVPGGTAPLSYAGKIVLTAHDLAIYRHPEWFPSQILSAQILYPQSLRKAARLIVPSEQTANDLRDIFKINKDKISIIHEGVEPRGKIYDEDILTKEDMIDFDDLKEKYNLRQPYVFFLGTMEPRKNLEFLISVFDELLKVNPTLDVQLVLAGKKGWKYERIFKLIDEVNAKYKQNGKAVNYLGYVPHKDKWALFENAACFVFPSLYEGFGLPPLEAMSVGAPVIASDAGALKEVIGKGGVLLGPNDFGGWLQAIQRILKEPATRAELKKAGKDQASQFSWSKCAQETLEVYKKFA